MLAEREAAEQTGKPALSRKASGLHRSLEDLQVCVGEVWESTGGGQAGTQPQGSRATQVDR